MSEENQEEQKKTGPEQPENPAAFARQLQDAIFRAVGEIGREIGGVTRDQWPFTPAPFSPRVDVIEEEERIRVLVDVPGVAEEDLEIELEKDYLLVRGERPAPEVGEGTSVRGNYGKFRRRIQLPSPIDQEKIDATLANGVLTVILPKKKAPRVKINVKRSE